MTPAPRDRQVPATAALDGAWTIAAALTALPLALTLALPGSLTPAERAAAAAAVTLAAWRPLDALLVLAALAPLGTTAGTLLGSRVSVTEWLLPAILLGSLVAVLRGALSTRDAPRWLTAAAVALAWLALASIAVQILRDRAWFETTAGWRSEAWSFFSSGVFTSQTRWRTASSGFALAGLALLVPITAALACRPGAAHRLAAMFAAGAVGAAAQNVLRVVEGAVRSADAWTAIVTIARDARISAAFMDKNAAGSYFALALLMVAGLLWHALGGRRWAAAAGWTAALLLAGTALYLTGSRVALAVTLPVALAALALSKERLPVNRRWLVVALVVAAATIALVATAQGRRKRNDAPVAVFVRLEFVATTWRMLQDHPLVGVGVGSYYPASARYSSEALRRVYPKQNAHNNFLQVAGELGLLGFASFVVLVGLPAWRAWRSVRATPDPLRLGLWSGTVAFLLTCLGGHPLLVPEVGAAFALALGTLAGATAPATPGTPTRGARWFGTTLALCAVLVTVSVPLRARAERNAIDLEYVVLGKERWVEADGVPQVAFRRRLAFYVAGDGHIEQLTLRPAKAVRQPVDVTVRLDGVPANVVRLSGIEARPLSLLVPRTGRSRFRIVSFEVGASADRGTRILVQRRAR